MAEDSTSESVIVDARKGRLLNSEVQNQGIERSARSLTAIVSSVEGEGQYTDIQEALDDVSEAGGGTVFIKNGTYVLFSDLTLPSRVDVIGESAENVILYFVGAYGVRCTGSNLYSTGTVTATKGSAIVTGSGSAWLANVVAGYTMVIDKEFYTVASVDSDTQITLVSEYTGATASGITYQTALYKDQVLLQYLLITGSTSDGLSYYLVDNFSIISVIVLSVSGFGYKINNCLRGEFEIALAEDCGDSGIYAKDTYFFSMAKTFSRNNAGDGLEGDNLSEFVIALSPANNNAGDGYNIINSRRVQIDSSQGNRNGRHGFYFSACNYTAIRAGGADGNVTDGIRLDADSNNNSIVGFAATSNGGYGVKIATANCDKNTLGLSQLISNTSGSLSDSGTATINANNQT